MHHEIINYENANCIEFKPISILTVSIGKQAIVCGIYPINRILMEEDGLG
jgi:hypothetical protein